MNQDAGLNEELSYWAVQSNKRRIALQATEKLDRADVHAIIDGQEYNFAMTEVYTKLLDLGFTSPLSPMMLRLKSSSTTT